MRILQFWLLALAISPCLAVHAAEPIDMRHYYLTYEIREHWMREANAALQVLTGSPCPFEAFGSVVVNHTEDFPLGHLVCIGANGIAQIGNPTLHGEIAAINNCTKVLTDPDGPYKLSAQEALHAYSSLSLYTNGEPCPMCAAAVRWAGFKELIYGTSSKTLIDFGWRQFRLRAADVFDRSKYVTNETRLIESVLNAETDPLYSWQFQPSQPCPKGCHRPQEGAACTKGVPKSEL